MWYRLAMPTRRRRAALAAAASGVFALLLLRPAYMVQLRRAEAARDPAGWAALATNGRFNLLLPQLTAYRYFDESAYAARVRQVLLHGLPYSPYWKEFRQWKHWLPGAFLYYPMAAIAWLTGGDLTVAWALAVALFGAVWFLFYFAVFRLLSGREDAALFFALLSALFPDFYMWLLDVNFSPSLSARRWIEVFMQQASGLRPHMQRLPPTFLSYLLAAFSLAAVWRLSRAPSRRPAAAVVTGAVVGALALVHPFEHAFASATLGFFALAIFLVEGKSPAAWNLGVAVGVSAALGAAHMALVSPLSDPQNRPALEAMIGLEYYRRPHPVSLVHALAGLWAWRLWRREPDRDRRRAWLLLGCAQAAALACRNLQMLTGYSAQPLHFITLGSWAGAVLLVGAAARALASASWRTPRLLLVAGALATAWWLAQEKLGAERNYRLFGLPRDVEAGLAWVNGNVPKDGLLLTPSMEVNNTAPIYTSVKTHLQPLNAPILIMFTREYYLSRVASLLKTTGIDVERFIAQRWLPQPERDRVWARLERSQLLEQRLERELLEPALWFFNYSYGDQSDRPQREGRALLRRLYREARTIPPPFWLWLNRSDLPLLHGGQPPGGKLRYSNDSVWIYEFAARP